MMISGIISGSTEARVASANSHSVARGFRMPVGPEEMRVDHQADADQHARHDAGQEQPADRDVAGRAVDHRHDARRNEIGHGRGAGDQRRREGAVVALLGHLRRHGAAQHRDVGRGRAGDAGKEHAEQGDDLRQAAAHMPDHGLRQADHAVGDVRRRHQLADQEEERHRQQDLGIDAVEHLADHRLHADRRQAAGHQHAGHQREGDRHAHVAEDQEQGRHEQEDRAVAHFTMPGEIVRVLRPLEAVAPAIDDLLDGEQHDQRAGDRHARRVGRERDQRGRAEAAHVVAGNSGSRTRPSPARPAG